MLFRMRMPGPILAAVLALAAIAAPATAESAAPGEAGPASFTLIEAVRHALSRSREVRLAGGDLRIAGEGRTQAGAGRLPRVDAGGDFTLLSEPPAVFIQGRETRISDQGVFRAHVTAEQTILDFGRTASRVSRADARVEAAEFREELSRETQALAVISAFLSARRAEELLKVAEESLAAAREHFKVAQDLYDQGVVAKNDVLAAEVLVANDEAARIAAENRVELSRSELALGMGYAGDAVVYPSPDEIPVPPGDAPAMEDSLKEAQDRRRELKTAEALVREGEAQLAAARAEFAPAFFGQGGYAYESNEFNPNRSVFSLLVGGRVNLFAGFADEAARREALLLVDRRKEELALLRDRVGLSVKRAHLAVVEARKRQAVAEVAVARAVENLRIQNDRYAEGLAISTEALDAQALLTRAKVDRQNAAFDLYEARYELLAARGELLEFLGPRIAAGAGPEAGARGGAGSEPPERGAAAP